MRTKSALDVRRSKNLPKVKDCADYIGTSRMRYYIIQLCVTQSTSRMYVEIIDWTGLKYSLDVYIHKKSCYDNWCCKYDMCILLCDVSLLLLGVCELCVCVVASDKRFDV